MLNPDSRDRDFPILRSMTYLNTAAEGIPPPAVGEALARYFADKLLGMDGRDRHFAEREACRAAAARLLGMQTEEIGLCTSSSEAYNLAALALRLQPGDEVVINDLDFPAGATPWLSKVWQATVRVWRSREGALYPEDLAPLLGQRTRLVAASLVSYVNGFVLPILPVIETIRRNSDALFALDVTQALGRIPLDLTDVDLVVSSTHKWILASHGGGIVGVPAHRAAEWTVPAGGWFNLENAFTEESLQRLEHKPGAAGFTVGMPNFPAIYAVRAGLEYIDGVGVAAIDDHARPLVDACREGLELLGLELLAPKQERSAGILAFRHARAAEIAAHLHERNIHVMQPGERIRISLHGYNTIGDVERILAAINEVI